MSSPKWWRAIDFARPSSPDMVAKPARHQERGEAGPARKPSSWAARAWTRCWPSSPSAWKSCACRRRSATRRAKEFDTAPSASHVLREQMRQIQKELGDEEDTTRRDRGALKKAIDEAGLPRGRAQSTSKKGVQAPVAHGRAIGREFDAQGPGFEWMTETALEGRSRKRPWTSRRRGRCSTDDHFGLDKIKRRILEYLAGAKVESRGQEPDPVLRRPAGAWARPRSASPLPRPPAASSSAWRWAARTTRPRSAATGAPTSAPCPATIIAGGQARRARRAGVLMLDEIDKAGARGGYHGDPSSALLEVLDPEQNSKFRDNYLGVDFDLSRVMFIATANQLDTIPGPLRDRMEVIHLPGYTEEEKLQIAKKYLVKRQLETNGLTSDKVEIKEEAIRALIADYTREAGWCGVWKGPIGSTLRNAAMEIAEGTIDSVVIDQGDLQGILGAKRFDNEVALRTSTPGSCDLDWRGRRSAGDILFIEASKTPGTGKLILTGQLGDVMKESAQAALPPCRKASSTRPSTSGISTCTCRAGATPQGRPERGAWR